MTFWDGRCSFIGVSAIRNRVFSAGTHGDGTDSDGHPSKEHPDST